MIGCLGTRVRKQPIVLYFESETVLKFLTSGPDSTLINTDSTGHLHAQLIYFSLIFWNTG